MSFRLRGLSEALLDRTRPDGSPLRTGYTTGANACAAACAAVRVLAGIGLEPWEGPLPELTADRYDTLAGSVLITLPNGDQVRFPVRVAERREDAGYASSRTRGTIPTAPTAPSSGLRFGYARTGPSS